MITSKKIISIYSYTMNSISRSSSYYSIPCILILLRCWNCSLIISTQKQSLTIQSTCEIQSGMKISFASSAFSKINNCNSVFIIKSKSIPSPTSLWNFSSKWWRYIYHVMLLFSSIMYWHLSSFGNISRANIMERQ